ncbi:Methyltransferase domain [Geoglobus ahangari]|uniref:Methyltransferase domain n=1 Tax=Geoglobus ahangari TaxID=113653 RepID=A0A0F7IGS2_9EURY|nr:methyltransferase domain-containing protein [Geoglobus ahangari]AKG91125.1 Methyltransferase domain [Geoglobus ahangari]
MGHRFSGRPEELWSERRRQIMPTDVFEREVISRVRGRRGTAVDYGAGSGYFTEVLARHFRRVYAIDAEWKMVEALRAEMEKRGIANVGAILSDRPVDFDFPVDFILFSNVLHEVDEPEELVEWSRIARFVCVIDWKKVETDFGPLLDERIGEEEMRELLEKHFSSVVSLDIYPYHYVLICHNEEDGLDETD